MYLKLLKDDKNSHISREILPIYIYIYLSGVNSSVGQPKASKPEVQGSTPASSCFLSCLSRS